MSVHGRRAPQVIRVWEIQHKRDRRLPHIVRWTVDRRPHSRSRRTKPQAERFRSRLIAAQDAGEWFDPRTGEPESWRPQGARTPVYDWARTYLAEQWSELAPRTRTSYVEALARFVPLCVADNAPAMPEGTWRWLNVVLRPDAVAAADDPRESWLRRWGLTLGELDRPRLALVDAQLGLGAEGQQLAARTAGRFRKYSKACIRRAVALDKIPADPWPPDNRGRSRRKANRVVDAVDIRRLPDPPGITSILGALLKRSQPYSGRTWHAISAVGYYAGLRPSETLMLRRRSIHLPYLPAGGWGLIEVVEADDGDDNAASPKTGNRLVPMPPALVTIMHAYLAERSVAADELLFRTKKGTRPDMSGWRGALRRACRHTGVPPLAPYDLRHACATTWLRGGVPLGEAARRLGHSVKTLVTHYIQALDGDADIANARIEAALAAPSRGRLANNAQHGATPHNNGQRESGPSREESPAQTLGILVDDGGPDGI